MLIRPCIRTVFPFSPFSQDSSPIALKFCTKPVNIGFGYALSRLMKATPFGVACTLATMPSTITSWPAYLAASDGFMVSIASVAGGIEKSTARIRKRSVFIGDGVCDEGSESEKRQDPNPLGMVILRESDWETRILRTFISLIPAGETKQIRNRKGDDWHWIICFRADRDVPPEVFTPDRDRVDHTATGELNHVARVIAWAWFRAIAFA